MKPEDFGLSLREQAYRLRHFTIARSSMHHELDDKSAMWLIRRDQRDRLLAEMDMRQYAAMASNGRDTLLGIPIRWTIADRQDTPEIQLVMEPLIGPRVYGDSPLNDVPRK